MIIRPETEPDQPIIHQLTKKAFEPMPYASGTEAEIIDRLRARGALTLSLVAEDAGKIIGHVAFSPVRIAGLSGSWIGLGPISVTQERQRQGIARSLVNDGLAQLRLAGHAGCALIGSDRIYPKLGFSSGGALHHRDLPERLIHWISFDGTPPAGELEFHPAFEG